VLAEKIGVLLFFILIVTPFAKKIISQVSQHTRGHAFFILGWGGEVSFDFTFSIYLYSAGPKAIFKLIRVILHFDMNYWIGLRNFRYNESSTGNRDEHIFLWWFKLFINWMMELNVSNPVPSAYQTPLTLPTELQKHSVLLWQSMLLPLEFFWNHLHWKSASSKIATNEPRKNMTDSWEKQQRDKKSKRHLAKRYSQFLFSLSLSYFFVLILHSGRCHHFRWHLLTQPPPRTPQGKGWGMVNYCVVDFVLFTLFYIRLISSHSTIFVFILSFVLLMCSFFVTGRCLCISWRNHAHPKKCIFVEYFTSSTKEGWCLFIFSPRTSLNSGSRIMEVITCIGKGSCTSQIWWKKCVCSLGFSTHQD